jgi:hypothetical protein
LPVVDESRHDFVKVLKAGHAVFGERLRLSLLGRHIGKARIGAADITD